MVRVGGIDSLPRFAHMSDIHIGAFSPPELKEPLLSAFEKTLDICMERKVDFIVLAGDIFDSNIPDLLSVRRATSKIKEARDRGIRFYVVYGSHDFSPSYSSIVDVLESAGLFIRLDKTMKINEKFTLRPVTDPTGANLTGLSGKKLALDRLDYQSLDTSNLEDLEGFKIFVFHGAIAELRPAGLERMEAMSSELLPPGFNYYAGGHVHMRSLNSLPGRKNIAYPGPLYGADYRDLEAIARGEERGFYMVDFEEEVEKIEFIPVKTAEIIELSYSAEGKSSVEAESELMKLVRSTDIKGKIVLLRVFGQLQSGKTSDVDFAMIRREMRSVGALYVLQNQSQFSSKEQIVTPVLGRSRSDIEAELFRERMAGVNLPEHKLKGEEGVKTSLELLRVLKERRKENEVKSGYEERVLKNALNVLGVEVTQE